MVEITSTIGRLRQWCDDGRPLRRRPAGLERSRDRRQLGIRCLVAGDPEDDLHVGNLAERSQHAQFPTAQLLGEIHDRVGELWGYALPGGELGVLEQVTFVVPVGPQIGAR